MLLLFTAEVIFCQSAVDVNVGLITNSFADETGSRHYGNSIGFDVVVEDSPFLFMPGMHYQRYAIDGSSSRMGLSIKGPLIHQVSIPANIGTRLWSYRRMKWRIYGGGHLSFIVAVDNNDRGIHIDRINTVQPGWQAGTQLQLWKITADLRYAQKEGEGKSNKERECEGEKSRKERMGRMNKEK